MTIGASINCPKFESSFYNQTTSHATIATPLYSASVPDNATIGCFLLLQLTAPCEDLLHTFTTKICTHNKRPGWKWNYYVV